MAGERVSPRRPPLLSTIRCWLERRLAAHMGAYASPEAIRGFVAAAETRVMRLPDWQRQLGSIVILVLASLLGWQLVVAPQIDCYRSTAELRAARERLLQMGVAHANQGTGIEVEGRQLPERLATLSGHFFSVSETAGLVESLAAQARTHGLEWVKVDVGVAEPLSQLPGLRTYGQVDAARALELRAAEQGSFFAILPISFEVVGTAAQVLDFLDEIWHQYRLLLVQTIDMRRTLNNRVEAVMIFNMVLLEIVEGSNEEQEAASRGVRADADRLDRDISPGD